MRIVVVGVGSRSAMFTDALRSCYQDRHHLVGLCDSNPGRLEYALHRMNHGTSTRAVNTAGPAGFEKLLRETGADTVVVTSVDRTHHDYIVRGLAAGCDVITEKPMTIDEGKIAAIFDAIGRSGKSLRVAFNYRYAPRNSKVKELLSSGVLGRVTSVHFEWLLDTRHGADYFRRWHRDKRNSGGLLVHKATHHFDLVNWWLDDRPETVFALGDLVFYGRANAESRGIHPIYDRGTGSGSPDGFALDLSLDPHLRSLYLENEHHDGYLRDRGVFTDGISIEDDLAVLVRYSGGAMLSYHLTAYSPWEGFRIAFNGTAGRLEYEVAENTYVSGTVDDPNRVEYRDEAKTFPAEPVKILVRPLWQPPFEVPLEGREGTGHGGGDKRMLEDLFGAGSADDLLLRAADFKAGAWSALVGIAANRSLASGLPVKIRDLFDPDG